MIEVLYKVRSQSVTSVRSEGESLLPSLSFVRLGKYPAYYWRDREECGAGTGQLHEVIGLGCAAEFEFHSFTGLKDFLYHYEDFVSSMETDLFQRGAGSVISLDSGVHHRLPPLFAAIPFDCHSLSNTLSVPAKIVVPSSAIVRQSSVDSGTSITLYSTDGDFNVAKAALAEIERYPGVELDFSEVLLPGVLESRPDLGKWHDELSELEKGFFAGELLKVVLAHEFRFPNVESHTLSRLLRFKTETGVDNRFRFLMARSDSEWFYSRSPERLLEIEGNVVRSEALGGTLRQGESVSNEKLDREHLAIVDRIDHDLRKCGIVPQWGAGDFERLDLGTIRHLWHPVRGLLPESASRTDLLFTLHPTPAVCGFPRDAALRALGKFEEFDRRFYGGPLGIIHGSSWNFMAGLRTVFAAENHFRVPIGVGIVQGSNAEDEVAEIYAKFDSL